MDGSLLDAANQKDHEGVHDQSEETGSERPSGLLTLLFRCRSFLMNSTLLSVSKAFRSKDTVECSKILLSSEPDDTSHCLSLLALDSKYHNWDFQKDPQDEDLIVEEEMEEGKFRFTEILARLLSAWQTGDEAKLLSYTKLTSLMVKETRNIVVPESLLQYILSHLASRTQNEYLAERISLCLPLANNNASEDLLFFLVTHRLYANKPRDSLHFIKKRGRQIKEIADASHFSLDSFRRHLVLEHSFLFHDQSIREVANRLPHLGEPQEDVSCLIDANRKRILKGPLPVPSYRRALFVHNVMRNVFQDTHTLECEGVYPYLSFPLCGEDVLEKTKKDTKDLVLNPSEVPISLWLHFVYRYLLGVDNADLQHVLTNEKKEFFYGTGMDEERKSTGKEKTLLTCLFSKPVKKQNEYLKPLKTHKSELHARLSDIFHYTSIQKLAEKYSVPITKKDVFKRKWNLLQILNKL